MKKKYTEPEFESVKFLLNSTMYELNPSENNEFVLPEDVDDFPFEW